MHDFGMCAFPIRNAYWQQHWTQEENKIFGAFGFNKLLHLCFFCEDVYLGLSRETDEIWKSCLIVLRGVCATHWESYFLTFHLVESGSRLPSIYSTNT